MLKFSPANAKTKKLAAVPQLQKYLTNKRKVYSLDLLSGWSCPFAKECKSQFVNGKIVDGEHCKFRCFSASQEVAFPIVFRQRKHNFDLLRRQNLNDMIRIIVNSLPKDLGILRLHVAGDFFNADYMFAWLNIAMSHTDRLFYAYTKSIRYWLKHKTYIDQLDNFILTASYGGKDDVLIAKHNLRSAKVVFSEKEAELFGLPIDHDDSHAATNSGNFALLLHGVQPKGSTASKALAALKGKGSYRRKVVA